MGGQIAKRIKDDDVLMVMITGVVAFRRAETDREKKNNLGIFYLVYYKVAVFPFFFLLLLSLLSRFFRRRLIE